MPAPSGLLRLVVQTVLLHGYLRVSQQVLLLSQFCFGIQNLKVEVRIAQTNDDIAFMYHRSFLNHLFHDDATFLGRNLYHLDRQYLSVGTHIVLELRLAHIAEGQLILIDSER